jgi:hypothetical protein
MQGCTPETSTQALQAVLTGLPFGSAQLPSERGWPVGEIVVAVPKGQPQSRKLRHAPTKAMEPSGRVTNPSTQLDGYPLRIGAQAQVQ